MKEMGFREQALDSVKEAFVKHLIKVSMGIEIETPSEKKHKKLKAGEPQQLNLFSDQLIKEKDVG